MHSFCSVGYFYTRSISLEGQKHTAIALQQVLLRAPAPVAGQHHTSAQSAHRVYGNVTQPNATEISMHPIVRSVSCVPLLRIVRIVSSVSCVPLLRILRIVSTSSFLVVVGPCRFSSWSRWRKKLSDCETRWMFFGRWKLTCPKRKKTSPGDRFVTLCSFVRSPPVRGCSSWKYSQPFWGQSI